MDQKNTTRSKRRSAAQWQAIFSEQAASGLSVKAFCAEREIGYSTFSNWKARLEHLPQSADRQPGFIELSAPEVLPSTHWDVEVTLGTDIVLRVARR